MHTHTNHDPFNNSSDLSEADRPLRPHAGAWVDLGCTAFALLVDLLAIAAAVHFFHTGLLPGWHEHHGGTWAWFGAGADACWWVLVETPDAAAQLAGAWWQLSTDRLYARIAAGPVQDGAH
jgi:hypothetical protein